MKGQVLDYSVQTNSGLISGEDGTRYTFIGSEWRETVTPSRGMRVDFETQGTDAISVYRTAGTATAGGSISEAFGGEKNKLVAGLLGIFLGWVGAHKFYLGFRRPARIQAAIGGGGLLALIVFSFILSPIALAAGGYSALGFVAVLGILGTIGWLVMAGAGVIGLIEGIMYLTKSDDVFEQIYVTGKKQWF